MRSGLIYSNDLLPGPFIWGSPLQARLFGPSLGSGAPEGNHLAGAKLQDEATPSPYALHLTPYALRLKPYALRLAPPTLLQGKGVLEFLLRFKIQVLMGAVPKGPSSSLSCLCILLFSSLGRKV